MGAKTIAWLLIATAIAPQIAVAASSGELVTHYATEAKKVSASFSGLSAARGERLHTTKFGGGNVDTPACTSCHGANPRSAGRAPGGKAIEPLAVSVAPTRFTDPNKVEKWFKRNCKDVLGRECTPLEKGDWLTYMIGL